MFWNQRYLVYFGQDDVSYYAHNVVLRPVKLRVFKMRLTQKTKCSIFFAEPTPIVPGVPKVRKAQNARDFRSEMFKAQQTMHS